jgi:hypothetical protein
LAGCAGADYKLQTIETAINKIMGDNTDTEDTVYIVDNSGRLIASSIQGMLLDPVTNEWGVLAIESIEVKISATAVGLLNLKGSWSAADSVKDILVPVPGVGLCWVKATEATDRYGLHWHIVVVEVVHCEERSYLNEGLVDGYPCVKCPSETMCDGNSKLNSLDIKPGHWRISSESNVVLKCPIEEACVGGSNADNYCEEGYEGFYVYHLEVAHCPHSSSLLSTTGPLCSYCDLNDYYFVDESATCEKCEVGTRNKLLQTLQSPVIGIVLFLVFCLMIWGLTVLFAVFHAALGSPDLPKQLDFLKPLTNFFEKMKPMFKTARARMKLKIKVALSFAQISSNIAFNCAVSFPKNFDQVLHGE